MTDIAIGGSVAIILHAEPIHTDDLDFFIHLNQQGLLVNLGPIFQKAATAGATVKGEYLVFGNSKFQFIVAGSPLEEEAMAHTQTISAWGIEFRVFAPEYVVALKLHAFRPKDRVHIAHLIRTARVPVDSVKLEDIVERHQLSARWAQLKMEAGL